MSNSPIRPGRLRAGLQTVPQDITRIMGQAQVRFGTAPLEVIARPHTIDPASIQSDVISPFNSLGNQMFLTRLKGVAQDMTVDSLSTHVGYLSAGTTHRAGIALYEYSSPSPGAVILTLLRGAWFDVSDVDFQQVSIVQMTPPVVLSREKSYVVGVVPTAVDPGGSWDLNYPLYVQDPSGGLVGFVKYVPQITESGGFPERIRADLIGAATGTSADQWSSLISTNYAFLTFANPMGGYGHIY